MRIPDDGRPWKHIDDIPVEPWGQQDPTRARAPMPGAYRITPHPRRFLRNQLILLSQRQKHRQRLPAMKARRGPARMVIQPGV